MPVRPSRANISSSMRTSPWIILGSTLILLVVIIVFAVQNSQREKLYMAQILRTKGAALIRAVEAGARAGMMGMMWGGNEIQRLLEETGRLPDVLYMAVVDKTGAVVAHSDPDRIGQPFRHNSRLVHLGPDLQENWEVVEAAEGSRSFEVHRHFRPLTADDGDRFPHHMRGMNMQGMGMRGMMRGHGMASDDWFAPSRRSELLIVAGLDIAPFEAAAREDIRATVVMSVIILLTGFAGFVSLFWMNSYRAARRSLQDTSAFADELVAHLPVGLIATDEQGRIIFFNPAAETITGLSAEAATGRKAESVLPDRLRELRKDLDQGDIIIEQETEYRPSGYHHPQGQAIPLSISASRIVNDLDAFIGHVFILRDLREVRRLEAEVRRRDKFAALGKLAAGVAHEIRNPLSSIKGMAAFFADQFAEGSEARNAAGVMIQETDRLNRAVSELLDLSRPADLKFQAVDIPSLLDRSVQLIRPDAANQDVEITLETAENLCPAHADPDRLNQCLLNLYLNALQAMGDGGRLEIRCDSDSQGAVRICVEDTGPGIDAAHLGRIFDPYFTTKNRGTGLGLAMVQKIIHAHEGRLDVDSVPGKGTVMAIRLPCAPDSKGDDRP